MADWGLVKIPPEKIKLLEVLKMEKWYDMQKVNNTVFKYKIMERKSIEQKRKEFLERIAKERGIEITYNKDGTANIKANLFNWENVPDDKISKVLDFELRTMRG